MKAIASSRNFLHTTPTVIYIRSGFKECPPPEKGNMEFSSVHHKHLHSTHCACLLHIAPHTRELHRDNHWYRRSTNGKSRERIKQGLIFLSDKTCPISHLSMKGNNLYVKYYKDHFKFLRNIPPCLHQLEPSHQVITPCYNAELVTNYLCKNRRCKIWGSNVSLNKYCMPCTQVI